jgi:hypothetical protein
MGVGMVGKRGLNIQSPTPNVQFWKKSGGKWKSENFQHSPPTGGSARVETLNIQRSIEKFINREL